MLNKVLSPKLMVQACLMFLLLLSGAATMRADVLMLSGTTTGFFNANGTPVDGTLSFSGGSFNGPTSQNGTGGFGQTGTSNGSFGSFFLGNSSQDFNNDLFTLNILFTAPTGIAPSQTSTFGATVNGQVSSVPGSGGAVRVVFAPTQQTYTFANGTQTGSFTLALDTLTLGMNQNTSVSGFITSTVRATPAVTPEPMSLTLLGTGLLSVAGAAYRKRKSVFATSTTA